ncbi:MAG: multiheme c-type cytochrome [Dermatophilaceae bacterium]
MRQGIRRQIAGHMLRALGIGTGLVVATLFLTYHFVISPKVNLVSMPVMSAISLGQNKTCVDCHKKDSPGVVQQYHDSKHAGAGVLCLDCHKQVSGQEKMTTVHFKVAIVAAPSPKNCARCHTAEVKESAASNHAAKSWYSVEGAKDFTPAQLADNHLLDPEGKPINKGGANPVYTLIGQDVGAASCKVCHAIGKKNLDGSFGDCSKCHLRHTFEVAQARKPETCGQCHLGPDHPQKEIYDESAHGAYYQANKEKFNMDAPSGTLTVKDFPAPTCATCHMSAFGNVKGTHNVGDRLKWQLQPEIAKVRVNAEKNRQTMTEVCLNCHTKTFIEENLTAAEKVIDVTNKNVEEGKAIIDDLRLAGLMEKKAFMYPLDFTYFELWHHEGRRARYGAVMFGPDYVNWHGVYEQKKALVEMKSKAAEMKADAAALKTKP